MKIENLIKKNNIRVNSKDIQKDDIFVCTTGLIDKHEFIKDAINKGCQLVITNKEIKDKIKYLKVNDIDNYLRYLLDLKYHYPLNNVNIIGVTGTDGKTTTATIIKDMIEGAYIGTNGVIYQNIHIDTNNTTPSIDYLFEYFKMFKDNHLSNIVMEVSSESYLTKRIPTLNFNIGLFLNISYEHLDKHQTFENYLNCKKQLLKNSKIKIINRDSPYFKEIVKDIDNYLTFGKKKSTLRIKKYQLFEDHTEIIFIYKKKKYKINSPLQGEYNVYNIAASIITLLALNYEMDDIIKRISYIKTIPGRMEKMKINNKNIIIDYAHTIKATYEIMKFMDKFYHKKIITVVGCAGGRYKDKRPLVGKITLKYSKKVYFTMDDPRDEDILKIIKEMISNTKKKNYEIEINRETAIIKAFKETKNDELLLILGKGRDNYMIIGNNKIPYSDIEVLNKIEKNTK